MIIAYKGTRYCGWQIQPNGDTIQARVMEAIKGITGEEVTVYASGRTDAGVHAAGQVVSFFTHSSIPDERFPFALNTKLPADIRVLKAETVSWDFHPRYSAHQKTYCYRLYTDPMISPFYDQVAWQVSTPFEQNHRLDMEAMKKAAEAFKGQHDFKGFMSTGSTIKDTVREIYDMEVRSNAQTMDGTILTEISVTGNGFLYNMVRIMAGTLVEVGSHRLDASMLPSIIASGDRDRAGITAPAKGLMLMEVRY